MRIPLLLLLFPLMVTSPVLAQRSFYFAQIGDGVFENIRFQTTVVLVNLGSEVTVEVEFFSTGSGAPLEVTLGDLGTADRFTIDLAAGGSVSLQTPGQGGLIVGYAIVTDPRAPDSRLLGGTAVFTRTDVQTGVVLYEAGVPASESLDTFTAFVDTLQNLDTGLALVNIGGAGAAPGQATDAMVSMFLFNTEFEELARTVFSLEFRAHVAAFIGQFFADFPDANEMQGSVLVQADAALAAVTLRQRDAPGVDFPDEVPTLTTFPVIEGAATSLAGTFAPIDSDRLAVTLQIPDFNWAREVHLRFMNGEDEVGSFTRRVAAGRTLSDVFMFPGMSESINLIEIELSGLDGKQAFYRLDR